MKIKLIFNNNKIIQIFIFNNFFKKIEKIFINILSKFIIIYFWFFFKKKGRRNFNKIIKYFFFTDFLQPLYNSANVQGTSTIKS